MDKAWLWILAGGFAEMIWAVAMKLSNGFTELGWDIVTGLFLVISMLLLNRGFKAGLPVGPCYAVWVGIGAVASVLFGVLFLGDSIDYLGWFCVILILAGVLGLNLLSDEDKENKKE